MSSVSSTALATFAAGCFWSVELAFQREPGVLSTQVGYTGGHQANPTYQQVCTGSTGHAEAVRLIYDPKVVSYRQLLRVFFDKHDSTQLNRQGNDVGTQYRSAIYYHTNEQKKEVETFIIEEQSKHRSKIATEVAAAGPWYAAEEYHQKYLEKGGQCAAKGDKTKIRCYG